MRLAGWEVWKKCEHIGEHLKGFARKKDVTYYADVAPLAGLDMSLPNDRHEIGSILDTINREEVDEGGPLLSAVVVHKANMMPGKGFFALARALGRFDGHDEDAYYFAELQKVHDYWKNH